MTDRYVPGADHKSRVVIGDPRALAYQWIIEYAKNISPTPSEDPEDHTYEDNRPVTAEELIDAAMSHQNNTWGEYICRGGEYEGFRVDMTFWDKLAIVVGRPRDEIEELSFFTCSC